jgi:hypothetical protein
MFDRRLLSPEVMNWIVLLAIVLPLGVFGINLRNNACSSILSYYIAPISSDCRYNPDVLSDVVSIATVKTTFSHKPIFSLRWREDITIT